MLKQDRNPERGRPSGIEGARRLRVDAKYVALLLNKAASAAGSVEKARGVDKVAVRAGRGRDK